MATLSAGYSFGATETVTNTKLAALVNNGTVTNMAQTDITSNNGLVYTGTTAPSDTDQIWVDTTSVPVLLRYYNSSSSAWVPTSELAIMTNKSSQTGASGRVLILDTGNSNSYTYTSTAGDTKFIGIETGSIANNASAPVINRGMRVNVLLEHSASAGTYIRTSTATGKAEPCVSTSTGVFGFLMESGTASASSLILGVNPNTATFTPSASNALSGSVIQVVHAASGGVATGSTSLPHDDTIPQSGEGNEFMTLAITPSNASNKLKIDVVALLSHSVQGNVIGALFQDSTANALAAARSFHSTSGPATLAFTHYMTAGTTSATTFKFRAGAAGGGTTTFNGDASNRLFGGVAASTMTITEIKA